ncbi:MAG: FAD-binding oxidoreductase, partial [Acidobacteriota bacterium]
VCAGAWARTIAATVNVDLPVEPQRRQIVWARSADGLPPGLPMVIDIGTGFHFRPARDFTSASERSTDERDVLFAYPDPDEPTSSNTLFDDAFIGKVYERAKQRSPFLFNTEVIRQKCRAGLYENTPDHHAILGGCEIAGLFFANGFSGHGVMHSPAAGRAVCEIVLGGRSDFLDVSSLSLDRFTKGELLRETAFI